MLIVGWSGALVDMCVENLENAGDSKCQKTQTVRGTWPNVGQ
jgi:hypothetical protein